MSPHVDQRLLRNPAENRDILIEQAINVATHLLYINCPVHEFEQVRMTAIKGVMNWRPPKRPVVLMENLPAPRFDQRPHTLHVPVLRCDPQARHAVVVWPS